MKINSRAPPNQEGKLDMRQELPPDVIELFFKSCDDHRERTEQIKAVSEYISELRDAGRDDQADDYLRRTREALQEQANENKLKKRMTLFKVFSGTIGGIAVTATALVTALTKLPIG